MQQSPPIPTFNVMLPRRIILWLCFMLGSFAACGAEPTVKVSALNGTESIRSGAISTLRLQIDNNTRGIRDGVLETTVSAARPYLLHDMPLTLAPGANFRTLTLPFFNEAQLRFRFIEGEQSTDAGEQSLAPASSSRSHLILSVTAGRKEPVRLFQFERLTSTILAHNQSRTNFARLAPDELPVNPFAFMACDIVVLDQTALATAREKSLTALAQWVDAGGSVFIKLEPDSPLSETAQTFLARLRTDEPAEPTGPVQMISPGMGRAVIWKQPLPADGEPGAEWDKAAMWLWKTKPELLSPPTNRNSYYRPNTIGWIQRNLIEQISSGARPLPFGMVSGLFLAFVVVAVSVDFFLLGRKYRKFTWILFPLECAAFAWALMAFANHRIGISEKSAVFVIVDIGLDGRVLRETKITAYLPGKTALGEHRADSALTTPLYAYSGSLASLVPPHFQGNPGGAMTVQTMRQKWTPCFFRDTSFPGGTVPTDLVWEENNGYSFAKSLTEYRVDWNRSKPVTQLSPNASSSSLDDLVFPSGANDRELITTAERTVGKTIYLYRKMTQK